MKLKKKQGDPPETKNDPIELKPFDTPKSDSKIGADTSIDAKLDTMPGIKTGRKTTAPQQKQPEPHSKQVEKLEKDEQLHPDRDDTDEKEATTDKNAPVSSKQN